ncbi:MAG TPA: IPT/TIG domain-containing protein [Thermoanaerobaculia bacterium]|jgi:plastocyanin|nr:IPT/TIG domain-containing protein [Thermoanaerobaculia bacterium]
MRFPRVLLSILLAAIVLPLAAEQKSHEATPFEVLLHQRHGEALTRTPRVAPPFVVTEDATASATKVFNVTARQFQFDFNPSPVVINQGDNVTLNVSVPNNDGSDFGHGFFLENYMDAGVNIGKGKTVSIQFIASEAGTFTFICTLTCGVFHSNMFGTLTVQAAPQNPAPTISGVTPASGPVTGGTTVQIDGANFQNNATVKFGANSATNVTFVSSTRLTAVTPAGAAVGAVSVTVTNPDSQSGSSAGFSYTAAGPFIGSVTPGTGSTAGGTTITISGTGFASGATVTIGGVAASHVVFVDASTLTAVTPLGPTNEQATQPKDVTVTNPDGQAATRIGAFTYTVPPLAVDAITPSFAPPAGGVTVTITGAGFTSGVTSSVTFGGTAATNVTVVNAVTLSAVAPAHALGTVDVVVRVGTATVTKTGAFKYEESPKRRRAIK